MNAENLKAAFEKLDKEKLIKYGIYAVIAIIVIVILFAIIKKFSKTVNNKLTEKQQEYINSLEIDETEISIPGAQMNSLIAKLKQAFGKYGYATDEEMVYQVFETLNNRSELLQLISQFGVYEGHTLGEWMNKELSKTELTHIQEILALKGIVYTF